MRFKATLFLVVLPVLAGLARGAEMAPFKLDGRTYVPIADNQAPTYTIRLSLAPPPEQTHQESFSVLFGADAAGNGYRLGADGNGWALHKMSGGRATLLAGGKQRILPSPDPVEVLIKRRLWLLGVALNGRVVAEVQDCSYAGGLVAVDARSSSPASQPVVQTVSELRFDDSFMFTEEDPKLEASKVWKTARGTWQVHSVRDDVKTVDVNSLPEARRPQKDLSANPFCLTGFADGAGLLWSGYWFWDDYCATVSVRNTGARAVGLAFNVADANDFFALRWENASTLLGPTPVELVHVQGGEPVSLAKVWVNGQKGQWYSLGVRTLGTRIQAILDGAVIMDVTNERSAGGGVGLYVEGGDGASGGWFDDVEVRTMQRIDYTSRDWLEKHARASDGSWETEPFEEPGMPPALALVPASRTSELLLGGVTWPAPLLRARVPVPQGGETVGFLAGMERPQEPFWRVALGRRGESLTLEILEQGESGRGTLAECQDVPLPEGDTVDLCADFTREGEISVTVDDALWLRAVRTSPASGTPGVYARKAKGKQFRRLAVCFASDEDKQKPAKQAFLKDNYMKHWSSPLGAWWPVEGSSDAYWHVGDFYGRSTVGIPLGAGLVFIHSATSPSEEGGYALKQTRLAQEGEPESCELELLRLGKVVAVARAEPTGVPDGTVWLHKDGPYLWLTAGGRELFCFRDDDPLPGTGVAVKGAAKNDLAGLKIERWKVRDYYFERAPADWHSVGNWVVTNRFSCDPRWSFMSAMTSSAGILFSKYDYEGDVTLEAFMGMMHGAPEGYKRVGDLNMALTTRPFDLSSGYCFVVSGWDPFWSDMTTYLVKQGKRLASCTRQFLPNMRKPGRGNSVVAVPWISGGRPVHGAWYYVKARKQGGSISAFVENQLAYECEDPAPIMRFSPAIWTYDVWIVVARVKVSYQRKVVPGRLVPPPAEHIAVTEPRAPAPLIVSTTHPGLLDDFEGGNRGWKQHYGIHGGEPSIVARGSAGEGHCLQVTNVSAGGTFGVEAPLTEPGIPVGALRTLRFDYRISPEAQINLYLDINGAQHFFRLTGPAESDALYRRLDGPGGRADGRWHTMALDVAAAYRQALGAAADPTAKVRAVVFGNLHPGLLAAGAAGNPTGASYGLDNFEAVATGDGTFEARAVAEGVAATLVAVDQEPDTAPTAQRTASQTGLAPARWYCHVRCQLDDGTLTPTAHLPFVVAEPKRRVLSVLPRDEAAWDYGPIRLEFEEDGLPDPKEDGLAIEVNGQQVGSHGELVTLGWRDDTLTIDLARAGIEIKDGEPCALRLSYGNRDGTRDTFDVRYTGSLRDDTTPPSAVEMVDLPMPADFETDLGSWKESGNAYLLRDDSTAASGRWSLMVQNRFLRNTFFAYVVPSALNVGQMPMVEFDYKVHDAVQVDFAINGPAGDHTVAFTDKSGENAIGTVQDIVADDTWRHAEFNLLRMVKGLPYVKGLFTQRYLGLADFGFRSAPIGAYYHIDNFRIVPLVAQGQEVKWRAHDAAGIRGYSFSVSVSPDDQPDDTIDTAQGGAVLDGLPAPTAYLHVKACDKAGNWGPVTHYRFLVDADPPLAAAPLPADGARYGSPLVGITVSDEVSTVDPDTLRVTVDGRVYTPDSKGVRYVPGTGRFVWDWYECAPPEEKRVPDGKTIEVHVAANDFAGNALEPYAWHWVMDYAKDRTPPTPPVVECTSLAIMHAEDFAEGTGAWRNRTGNSRGATVQRIVRDSKTKDYCAKLLAVRDQSFLGASAYEQPYDLAKHPVICFEYRIPAKTNVNLMLSINGQWRDVQMTAPKTVHPSLGKMDVETDAKWHFAAVDVLELAKKAFPGAEKLTVNAVAFGYPTAPGNKSGAYWDVDNFMVTGYGEPEAKFAWESRDMSGIAGYSVLFDRNLSAAPGQKVNVEAEGASFPAKEGGTYLLRVQACDAVGNWSGVRTYPYVVKAADESAEQAVSQAGSGGGT